MPLRVCQLTDVQARLYEATGKLPDCRNVNHLRYATGLEESFKDGDHTHVNERQALALVGADDGTGEAVFLDRGRRMMRLNVKGGWNPVGAMRVMQLTRQNSKTGAGRYKIECSVPHGRLLRASEVNHVPQATP